MKRKIDDQIGQKFAIVAGILMARIFSTPLKPNPRRCSFAAGPASVRARVTLPSPDSRFDVVGLGFIPGREWKGPVEVFVEEMRDNEAKLWTGCSFWAGTHDDPLYLLTDDANACFSFDGHALVPLAGDPGDRAAGIKLAQARLKQAALRLPLQEIERQRMM